MELELLLVAVIIIVCVVFRRVSGKLGFPMLLAFMLLGMVFGSDGLFKIEFSDYKTAEQVGSFALIFIIFTADSVQNGAKQDLWLQKLFCFPLSAYC